MPRPLAPMFIAAMFSAGCPAARDRTQDGAREPATSTTAPPPMAAPAGNVDLPRFPSFSPDGTQIVFSWRGDLWRVSAEGGHAVRLTRHPGDDLRSDWSRDGRRIAFDSDRNGFSNLYIMNADGTQVRQITDIDKPGALVAFGTDAGGAEVLTFTAALEGDVYRAPRPYMVSTAGGDVVRAHDAFGSEAVTNPDGQRVAFTRGGSAWSRRHYRGPDSRDVWLLGRGDGSFTRLTDWEGNDGHARWAGERLFFLSDREHQCVNLYRMDEAARGGRWQPLTAFTEHDVQSYDVSSDGRRAVLCVWDTLYSLALDDAGAKPIALTITANEDEQDNYQIKAIDKEVREAALSPDGKVMAMVAYGEVYLRNIDEKSPTIRVTESHAREKEIAWSPDGLKLYFVSDSDGGDSIYAARVALTRREVKEEFDKATKPPEEQKDAEKKEEEPEDEKPADKDESKKDEPADKKEVEDEPAKKDGKKKEDEVPKELKPERWHDAIRFTITPVVHVEHHDRAPTPSPDGKRLAFRRGRGDLMIFDMETGETRLLAKGWDTGVEARWSPDSRHLAYVRNDINFNADIWVVPADGAEPAVNVTRHPNNESSPRWSADGRILGFLSNRVNDEFDVWSVYLDADLESYTPREMEEYYENAAKTAKKRKPLPAKKPEKKDAETTKESKKEEPEPERDQKKDEEKTEGDDKDKDENEEDKPEDKKKDAKPIVLSLKDAYLRLRRITTVSGDEGNFDLAPGGERYFFSATIGEAGLYSVKWDGTDRKKLSDSAGVQHVSLTGDKLVIVNAGRAGAVKLADNKLEYTDISDKIRIDLAEQSSQKFLEAARALGEQFYHPTMKDLDWPALSQTYHALARGARTADEFNDVANRFIGELNASHLRITARGEDSPNTLGQGRLGTVHRRVESGFEVLKVIPEGPASKGPMALKPGDVITAIDQKPFAASESIESRLRGRSGKETLVTIRRSINGPPSELNVLITPVSAGDEVGLLYKAWRVDNARLVEEWSGGGLGYIHIQGMDQSSLDVFERDLYAAADGKKGLVIDVRNNGGGWTADRLLSSIMVQKHAYTVPRGADAAFTDGYPQDRLFIQRFTLPINMLCNEKSFSNAEITSHAFKTLKRGTLVGQQTYGGVISTGGTALIDGTFVRLPFRGWYLPDGTDMENHGAVPDLLVPQTPEAESKNDDEQLRAAVVDLLRRI